MARSQNHKMITMGDDLAQRLADYRFAHRHKSEAEAIRTLMVIALDFLDEREREAARQLAA